MQTSLSSRGFTLAFAGVAVLAIACADTAPTAPTAPTASANSPLDGLTRVAINDTGVTVPLESLPPDSVPPDSVPPDSIPPNSVQPDSIPPDSVPPDSVLPPPPPPTPGYFRGSVVGQFQAAPGSDSLAGAPRLANVQVTAYARLSASDPLAIGPPAASVLTDANGYFQLPTLAGGDYVIAFSPPAGSKYRGVWATATVNNHSADYPWWVVLSLK